MTHPLDLVVDGHGVPGHAGVAESELAGWLTVSLWEAEPGRHEHLHHLPTEQPYNRRTVHTVCCETRIVTVIVIDIYATIQNYCLDKQIS